MSASVQYMNIDDIPDLDKKTTKKISQETKELIKSFCNCPDAHSILNVTFKEMFEIVMTWALMQPVEVYHEILTILEQEMKESKGMCFTGRLSRLINVLNGIHPDVHIKISIAEQKSNRVLMLIEKNKHLSKEELTKLIYTELDDFDMTDEEKKEWVSGIDHMFIADDVPHGAPALGDFVHDDMIHEDLEAVDVADEDLEAVDVADEEQ